MAVTTTTIIKLGNGNNTYIPITSTEAVQHKNGANKVVLESYLNQLGNSVTANTTNIGLLTQAVINTYTKLEDYNASYIKTVEGHANQISYNLPNGTYGLITINNVAEATTATNLTNSPVINKTDASGANTDSFTVTAGEKTSSSVSLSKATASAYGVAKVVDDPKTGSSDAISASYAQTLATAVDSKAAADHKHTLTINNNSDYTPTDNTVSVISYVSKPTAEASSWTITYTRASVPTQKYVDDKFLTKEEFEGFSASGMHYKGDTTSVPSSPSSGDVWHVTSAISSGLGENVKAEVGDFIVAYVDGSTTTWSVWDRNVDGSLYKGSNSFTDGQMLVADGTSGKVKSQAIPTVSVSGTGTGNVVKTISNNDHSISYTSGYVYDTLEKSTGSANSGILTNITSSDNKLTVTYSSISSLIPNVADPSASGNSITFIDTISQTNGQISATKKTVSTMTGATTDTNGAVGLVPQPTTADVNEVVKVLGADGQWKTITAYTSAHDVTTNLKYATSNKTVDIDEGLFGTFTDGPAIVTIANHTAGVTIS